MGILRVVIFFFFFFFIVHTKEQPYGNLFHVQNKKFQKDKKTKRQIYITTLRKTTHKEGRKKKKSSLIKRTNQRTIGLISADRSNKATLLLTIPRSKFKSSAKDLSSLIFEVIIQGIR